MKRIITPGVALLTLIVGLATPARADVTTLAKVEVRRLLVTLGGNLRISIRYVCDADLTPTEGQETVLLATQAQSDGEFAYTDRLPFVDPSTIVCDGEPHDVVLRARPAHGSSEFSSSDPITVIVNTSLLSSDGRGYGGEDAETFEPLPFAAAETLAHTEITDVSFAIDGVLRVSLRYACPTGFTAGPERDAARLLVVQQLPGGANIVGQRVFTRRVVCDGTERSLVVRFQGGTSGEPFQPSEPIHPSVDLNLENGPQATLFAGNGKTLLA